MIVQKIEFTDIFAANCYFYIDEKSGQGVVIDPSAHADKLLKTIRKNNWKIEKILLTHSHLDHIKAVLALSTELNVPYFGSLEAAKYLSSPDFQAHFTNWDVVKNISHLEDGTIIKVGSCELKMIYTPGHTLDSCIYYDEKNGIAFTGDTIFKNGIGRTDIEGSGGNEQILRQNIRMKILTLPSQTILYPGHGAPTTVGTEKIFY